MAYSHGLLMGEDLKMHLMVWKRG